jgi:hypothetical protein
MADLKIISNISRVNTTMNKSLEWLIIISLVLILIGLGSCADKEIATPNNPKLPDTVSAPSEEDTSGPTVSKMGGIAYALGCMFAPDTCQAKKDLGETEENKQ